MYVTRGVISSFHPANVWYSHFLFSSFLIQMSSFFHFLIPSFTTLFPFLSMTERYTSSSSKTLDPSLFRPPWEESKGWNDRGSSRSRRSFYSSVVELERAERNDGDIERRVTAGGLAVSPNDVGRISKRSRINVMTPPRVKAVTNLTAVAGRPFTLSCPYSGYPVNEVYFLRGKLSLFLFLALLPCTQTQDTRHLPWSNGNFIIGNWCPLLAFPFLWCVSHCTLQMRQVPFTCMRDVLSLPSQEGKNSYKVKKRGHHFLRMYS